MQEEKKTPMNNDMQKPEMFQFQENKEIENKIDH